MSSISVQTFALVGLSTVPVTVEVDLIRRLPSMVIVGLPSLAVRESADRVRSAILAAGFEFPRQRVVVSLSPADLRKEGTGFDLPIAAAILLATGQIPDLPVDAVLAGELTLGGEVRTLSRGIVAYARQAVAAARSPEGINRQLPMGGLERVTPTFIGAPGNAKTINRLGGYAIPLATLGQLRELPSLMGKHFGEYRPGMGTDEESTPDASRGLDFADVRGLPNEVLNALIEAAINRTPVLLLGPPGCGKTMIAARCPGLLPTMTEAEALDVATVQDAAGLRSPLSDDLPSARPFRAPHHTISAAGLVGGALLRPGECSLASGGVLFLDELPEFPRVSLEAIRYHPADKRIVVARAGGSITLPADYWLIMGANRCPCGNLGHPTRECKCSTEARDRYTARLEAATPKNAVIIHLSPVDPNVLLASPRGLSTRELREEVACRTGYLAGRASVRSPEGGFDGPFSALKGD